MNIHRKHTVLFSFGLLASALSFASLWQMKTINSLKTQLTEKEKQVQGLQSFNQTLQSKMRHMADSDNPTTAFHQQSFNNNPKSKS